MGTQAFDHADPEYRRIFDQSTDIDQQIIDFAIFHPIIGESWHTACFSGFGAIFTMYRCNVSKRLYTRIMSVPMESCWCSVFASGDRSRCERTSGCLVDREFCAVRAVGACSRRSAAPVGLSGRRPAQRLLSAISARRSTDRQLRLRAKRRHRRLLVYRYGQKHLPLLLVTSS